MRFGWNKQDRLALVSGAGLFSFSRSVILITLLAWGTAHSIAVKVAIGPASLVDTANRSGAPVTGSCPAGFTCAAKGDASLGDIDDLGSGVWRIVASGSTDGSIALGQSIDYGYQTRASGDARIKCQIPETADWTGHSESFTGFTCGLTEATSSTDWSSWCIQFANGTRSAKYGTPGTSITSVTDTSAFTLPVWCAVQFIDSSNAVDFYTSDDGTDFYLVGSTTRDLSNYLAFCGGTSHESTATTTADVSCSYSTTADISDAGSPPPPSGNDHLVSTGTSTFDCAANNVVAGDTITLDGTSRGTIIIQNCAGSEGNPIVVRNDVTESGPLVISHTGSGFKSRCVNCLHVEIDGTGKYSGAPAGVLGVTVSGSAWTIGSTQAGLIFRCTSGAPQSTFKIMGTSKFVTVTGVEIDGGYPTCTTGSGIDVNDHNVQNPDPDNPANWREGIDLVGNYIHDTYSEGVYYGGNQNAEAQAGWPLRNGEISYNYILRAGWDAIEVKSILGGSTTINHNYIVNMGMDLTSPGNGNGGHGISAYEAGYLTIENNIVLGKADHTGEPGEGACIRQWIANLASSRVATVPITIRGNIVTRCKGTGINSGRQDGADSLPVPTIYNNTVTVTGGTGISCGSTVSASGVIRDNIAAGESVGSGACTSSGNNTSSVAAQNFVNAGADNYRLTSSSPARNAGATVCPSTDLYGVTRPLGSACDKGAAEYAE